MRSLGLRLLLAFLAVVLVAVGLLGVLVGRAASGAFEQYLISRETGDLGGMGRMMDEMMGPAASQEMVERMLGPAERAYLAAINDALWVAGGLAALAAARLMAAGDLDQRVPVRSRESWPWLSTPWPRR